MGVFSRQPAERIAYLWPDNLPAWHAWQGVQSQWRVGMGGATGLDYTGVQAGLRLQGHRGPRLRDLFAGIQACERATLDVWAEQRERDAAQRQNAPAGPGGASL